MDSKDAAAIHVGDFQIDRRSQRLWRDGAAIDLVPQVWTLLSLLIERAGQLVTKQEILERAWHGVAVSDAALSQAVRRLRSAFGDDARQPHYVETVHRRGFRLIAPVRIGDSAPAAAPRSPNASLFVGRRDEFDRLDELLRTASGGTRQIAFIEGEVGIGKTSLLRSFRARHDGGGLRVAAAQCIQQHGRTEPYLPVFEALDRLAKSSPAVLEVLRRHAPTWLIQMPWLVAHEEVSGLQSVLSDATRTRMLREMAGAVDVMAAEQPLLLLLEDLHWADEATLDLLASVARRPEPARLLVLATYRPAEAIAYDHPVVSLCRTLWASNLSARLSMQALSRAETASYLAQRFSNQLEDVLIDRIHARSEGNPLFLVAIVDHMVARGLVAQGYGGWRPTRSVSEDDLRDIPHNLREMIALQLASLDPAEQELLGAASVAAVEFRAASVAAALERPGPQGLEEVEASCEQLIDRRHLLRAVGEEVWPDGTQTVTYGFRHQLYRQVLYEKLPASRRRRFHQRIGERLEQGFAKEPQRVAAEIADHFARSGDDSKAFSHLVLASRQAHRRFADREAAHLLDAALRHLQATPAGPDRDLMELQLRLGIVLAHWLAELDRQEDEDHLQRIRTLAPAFEDRPDMFQTYHRLWMVYTMRSLPKLAEPLTDRLEKRAAADRPAERMEARVARGVTAMTRGHFAQAVESLTQALDLYGDGDPPLCVSYPGYAASWESTGARVHGFLGAALLFSGALDRASAHLSRALELCGGRVHPKYSAAAYLAVAGFLTLLGDVEIARASSNRGHTIAEENGFDNLVIAAAPQRAWLQIMSGQSRDARLAIAAAVRQYHRNRSFNPAPVSPILLADACRHAGLIDDGLALIEMVWQETRPTGVRWYDAELRRLEGDLRLACGGCDASAQAELCFRDAIEIASRQGARFYELRAATSLTRLAQHGRKRDAARELLRRVCATFTEGSASPHLLAAQALLVDLL